MPSLYASQQINGAPGKSERLFAPGNLLAFSLVTSLFFLWGIPNNLNDILIRQFMKSFPITRLEAGLVQSAFYMGYFLLALPSALYMRRVGYKIGFITGLLLFGLGTFLFWPAALVGKYAFFLIALFIMASGLSFLETASNTFITLAGSPETSERRLNFSQAFNPLGSIAGALIGTRFILSGVELSSSKIAELKTAGRFAAYVHSETLRVVTPYVVLGLFAFLLAFLIALIRFPVLSSDEQESQGIHLGRLLRNRNLVFAIVAQFFYVGTQVGTWTYFIQYIEQFTGQNEKFGGYLLTGTLAMFGVGRFTSAAVMKYLRPARMMGIYCIVNLGLVSTAVFHPGWIGVWTIFLTSFFMSLMYPTIFALGLHGLGSDSKVGGSLIVMAIVGGAVLTPLMGIIADSTNSLAYAYTIPLAGYLLIAAYAFLGQTSARTADQQT
jgi:FHS family L-fucose permease-like MFS transporter